MKDALGGNIVKHITLYHSFEFSKKGEKCGSITVSKQGQLNPTVKISYLNQVPKYSNCLEIARRYNVH